MKPYNSRWLCKTALAVSVAVILTLNKVTANDSLQPTIDLTNNISLPPPFSPSLEHIIHKPSTPDIPRASNKAILTDTPTYELRNRNLDMPGNSVVTVDSTRQFASLGAAEKENLTNSTVPREIVPIRGDQSANVPQEDDQSGLLQGALISGDEYDAFGSAEEMCPPVLAPGQLRWRKGSRLITATLPHLVSIP